MNDNNSQSNQPNTPALEAGEDALQLKSGDDLALEALSQASGQPTAPNSSAPSSDSDDEAVASDQIAQTLTSLQNVIERNANELERLGEEIKHKRESLKNIFENDTQLGEAEAQMQVVSEQLKERKAKLQSDPQVTSLKVQIGEINEQKKELEETLSNHLVNYYQLTNSTSFDTSDGDQWEFNIRAKVKPRKKAA
ncbi:MAG TPA: hypothetical protein VD999_06445 [Vitreimonas sp.]|nr:hypothetical protein [Vitreimonas sp.]